LCSNCTKDSFTQLGNALLILIAVFDGLACDDEPSFYLSLCALLCIRIHATQLGL